MEVKRLRIVIVEIFKRLHDLNPIFMKDIFHYCQNKSQKKHNLHNHNVHSRNTSRYGNNSLRVLGAHIWNRLPENIKCTDSAHKPKNPLKGWHDRKRHPRITTRRHPPQQNTQREGNGRAVGGPPDLIRFLETVFFFLIIIIFFYLFLLGFYVRILILYTPDFTPRINKDIILVPRKYSRSFEIRQVSV